MLYLEGVQFARNTVFNLNGIFILHQKVLIHYFLQYIL
jgi:hypothetical protein